MTQRLITENVGSFASITQALHNYFRVGDASAVDVDGVDGLDYLDKFENYATPRRQQGAWTLRDPVIPGAAIIHAGQGSLCPA